MSLRPDGTRLLVIRSMDGVVLYEGDGQVQVGLDPAAVPGADGSRNAQWEDPDEQEPERTWGEMIQATIRNQIRARAEAVHMILEAYDLGPDVLGPPPPETREYWDSLIRTAQRVEAEAPVHLTQDDPGIQQWSAQRGPGGLDVPAWEARWHRLYENGTVRASEAAAEFEQAVTGPLPEHDEQLADRSGVQDFGLITREQLVAATRSEFPYDPYDYGEILAAGPMVWSPPEDGQEVPRCP